MELAQHELYVTQTGFLSFRTYFMYVCLPFYNVTEIRLTQINDLHKPTIQTPTNLWLQIIVITLKRIRENKCITENKERNY